MKASINNPLLAAALFLTAIATSNAATVLATLNSQDRIVGERQTSGSALGYNINSADLTVGVGGSNPSRINTNVVIGFVLPTLSLGETISAANFSITIASSNGGGGATTVSLHGLSTTNPDSSGITLFSESATGAINASFTTNGVTGTPSSDVTAFIQSFYADATPLTPSQTEVFFRLNETADFSVDGSARRVTFTNNTAALSLTTIPEPSAALLGGLGMLVLLRRRR